MPARPLEGLKTTDIRFDRPLYSIPEAARLVGVRPTTLRNWLASYEHVSGGRRVKAEPVVDLTVPDATAGISFINLIEVLALDRFRDAGSLSKGQEGAALRGEGARNHARPRQPAHPDGRDRPLLEGSSSARGTLTSTSSTSLEVVRRLSPTSSPATCGRSSGVPTALPSNGGRR